MLDKIYFLTEEQVAGLNRVLERVRNTPEASRPRGDAVEKPPWPRGVYVALTPVDGIPAATKATGTGSGTGTGGAELGDIVSGVFCQVYRIEDEGIAIDGNGGTSGLVVKVPNEVKVWNVYTTAIPGNELVIVEQDNSGTWLVVSGGGGGSTNGAMSFNTGSAGTDFHITDTDTPAAWADNLTYSAEDTVSYLGTNYASLQDGNFDNPPSTSPTWWEVVTKVITWDLPDADEDKRGVVNTKATGQRINGSKTLSRRLYLDNGHGPTTATDPYTGFGIPTPWDDSPMTSGINEDFGGIDTGAGVFPSPTLLPQGGWSQFAVLTPPSESTNQLVTFPASGSCSTWRYSGVIVDNTYGEFGKSSSAVVGLSIGGTVGDSNFRSPAGYTAPLFILAGETGLPPGLNQFDTLSWQVHPYPSYAVRGGPVPGYQGGPSGSPPNNLYTGKWASFGFIFAAGLYVGSDTYYVSGAPAVSFVNFTISGGVITVRRSFGVFSVTYNGVGNYTITFIFHFADAEAYTAASIATSDEIEEDPATPRTATTITVKTKSGGDPARVGLIFVGEIAAISGGSGSGGGGGSGDGVLLNTSTQSLADNATTLDVTGSGFSATAGNDTPTFGNGAITGTISSATTTTAIIALSYSGTMPLGPLTMTMAVTAVGNSSMTQVATVVAAPTLDTNTANLPINAGTITLTGAGFDPNPAGNTVTFDDGAVGTVISASSTSLTVQFTTPPTSTGTLNATVNSFGGDSNTTQVATVVSAGGPWIATNTTVITASAATLTITGASLDAVATNDYVVFSSGAGTTTSVSGTTSITVTFSTAPSPGPLYATVTTPAGTSNTAQVATVVVAAPVVSMWGTPHIATDDTGFAMQVANFDPTIANDTVTTSTGSPATITDISGTAVTVSVTAPLTVGTLTASVTSNGISSGAAVAVVTVVNRPTITSATLGNTSVTINGANYDPTLADYGIHGVAPADVQLLRPDPAGGDYGGGFTAFDPTTYSIAYTAASSGSVSLTWNALGYVGDVYAVVHYHNVGSGTGHGPPGYPTLIGTLGVAPTITPSTANLSITATTLTINGGFFNATAANDTLVLSQASGSQSGTVNTATTSVLGITSISGLVLGPLYAQVTDTTTGLSSAVTQVATVVSASTGGYDDGGGLTITLNTTYGGGYVCILNDSGLSSGYLDLARDFRVYTSALGTTDLNTLALGDETTTITATPIRWWKCNEGSGSTAADSSSGHYDATNVNGLSWSTSGGHTWLNGLSVGGPSLWESVNGSGGTGETGMPSGAAAFTLTGRVNTTSSESGGGGILITFGLSSPAGEEVQVSLASGLLTVTNGSSTLQGSVAINDGVDHLWAVIYDGTTLRLWHN